MATTHKTVHKTPGAGDYTTVGDALAASSSGSAGDYSTITILDSGVYIESVAIANISYLRITCASGCSPSIQHLTTPVSIGASATFIEIVGHSAADRVVLRLAAGANNNRCLYYTASGYSVTCQYVTFLMAGLAGFGMAPGNTTGTTVLYDCTLSGTFTNFLNATQADVTCIRCDFTGGVINDTWARLNHLGLTMNRCLVNASTLLTAQGGFGIIADRKWVITNNIFIGTAGAPFLELWDGWGVQPNADVFNNLFYKSGAAGSSVAIGVTGVVSTVSIKNNGFVGWGYGINTANSITVSNNGFYSNTNKYVVKVTSLNEQTANPQFASAPTDFHIPAASPWIDTGANTGLTDDYAGAVRPLFGNVGVLYDIGPYELAGDVTPPEIQSIVVESTTSLLVTFTEQMSLTGLDDTGNYEITEPALAIPVTISLAAVLSSTQVRLTTSPHTNGRTYELTPSNLKDPAGNTVVGSETYVGVHSLPTITGISYPVGTNTVTVEFSDAMPNGIGSAVNYLLTGGTVHAVTPGPGNTSVAVEADAVFVPATSYMLSVLGGVQDAWLNSLDPGSTSVSFTVPGFESAISDPPPGAEGGSVVIVFSEPMDNSGGALEVAGNYTFVGVPTPEVPSPHAISAVSATVLTPDSVRVITETPTDGGTYEVSATVPVALKDTFGTPLTGSPVQYVAAAQHPKVTGFAPDLMDGTLCYVLFDMPMHDDPLDAVFDPASYIINSDHPVVPVSVAGLYYPGPILYGVVLTVAPALTPLIEYEVVVSGDVIDVEGNGIDPAHDSASFLMTGDTYRVGGYYLLDGATTTLGGVLAATKFVTDKLLMVGASEDASVPGDVVVTNPDGKSGTLKDAWEPPAP